MRPRTGSGQSVDWWGRDALRLHTILIVGLAGSGLATWFEWTRALSGHEIAWAYSFEWPLFALIGIHIWWRLLHQEVTHDASMGGPATSSGARTPAVSPLVSPAMSASVSASLSEDPELAAWEAYLARLHAADPPGGPPARSTA